MHTLALHGNCQDYATTHAQRLAAQSQVSLGLFYVYNTGEE